MYQPSIYHPSFYVPYPHLGGPMPYSGHLPHGWPLWKAHPFAHGKRLSNPSIHGDLRHQRMRFRHPMDYNIPQIPHHPVHHHPFAPTLATHPSLVTDAGYLYHDPLRPLAFQGQHAGVHPYHLATTSALPHHASFSAFGGSTVIPVHHMPHHVVPPQSSLVIPTKDSTTISKDKNDNADNVIVGKRSADSPSSGIQLLPNVKHVPSHLLSKSGGERISPKESIPVATVPVTSVTITTSIELSTVSQSSLTITRNKTGGRVLSSRSYSPANYARDKSGVGESSISRSYSPINLPRDNPIGEELYSRLPQSPEYFARGKSSSVLTENRNPDSCELTTSLIETQTSTTSTFSSVSRDSYMMSASNQSHQSAVTTNLNSRRKGPNLKLNTGFSRQYSDEVPTPSYITNMIKMIDDVPDEDVQSRSVGTIDRTKPVRKPKKTVAQTLQQHLVSMKGSNSSSSSTSDDLSDDSARPSYASILSRSPDNVRLNISPEAFLELEIQTPQTPKGFITPGADMEVDPLGILKSLNIGNLPHK